MSYYGNWFSEEVLEIRKMQSEGKSVREIILSCEAIEPLEMCGIPSRYLIPQNEGQKMPLFDDLFANTSPEGKWEYNGKRNLRIYAMKL